MNVKPDPTRPEPTRASIERDIGSYLGFMADSYASEGRAWRSQLCWFVRDRMLELLGAAHMPVVRLEDTDKIRAALRGPEVTP